MSLKTKKISTICRFGYDAKGHILSKDEKNFYYL